jgi:hypothetical protein
MYIPLEFIIPVLFVLAITAIDDHRARRYWARLLETIQGAKEANRGNQDNR